MNDEEFMLKLREAFSVEAEEHLQTLTASLLDLEKAAAPDVRAKITETIFREAHSLKGAARAVNRTDIEAICHGLESVFAGWKRKAGNVSAETFDVLNRALDHVGKLRAQPDAADAERPAVLETVRQVTEVATPVAARSQRPPQAPPPASVPEKAAMAPVMAESPAAIPAVAPVALLPEPPSARIEHLSPAETVRVPLAKLDSVLLQAEEMVGLKLIAGQQAAELREAKARLETWRKEWLKVRRAMSVSATPQRGAIGTGLHEFLEWNESQIEGLGKSIAELTKSAEQEERTVTFLVDDLLADAKRLVMLPFARLLNIFPKQVRDLSREQGKEIDLIIHGSEVEIDKRILEEMKVPMIHLVRNAIDHGFERPDRRVARGKAPKGQLTIAVLQRDGNKVEIVVSDDGDGINVEKVKASAVKNGVIDASDVNDMSEAAALALVFQSGVSTSPILTEISGRGLGMAIVREKIEGLGGQIAIETKPGVGTSFRILLPVTLATFKGILITAGGQTFVVPTASVEKIKRPKLDEIKTVENRETIIYEDRVLALTWLADVLELPRREPKEPRTKIEVLILGAGEQRMAFAVEGVLHEQEVLVKNLGKPLIRVRNIAAATVLGSGAPVLILNIVDLLRSAVRIAASEGMRSAQAVEEGERRVRQVLVADDSVTSRMLLKNILESAGYHVTTAVDGLEAFTTLRSGEFDVVVSDVEMPRMDGFDLTTKIRADKKFAEVPVVLVTALSSREHRERGVDVGANAYIVKGSFDQSNLLEVLRTLV